MKSLAPLLHEHQTITRAVGVLQALVPRAQAGDAAAREDLRVTLEFFRRYGDGWHHEKEERLLFPALVAAGLPARRGTLPVLLREHEQGKALGAQMGAALEAGRWADLARAADKYEVLLERHVFRENHVLFRIAVEELTEAQRAVLHDQLLAADAAIEQAEPGVRSQLEARVLALAAELDIGPCPCCEQALRA